MAQQHAAAHHGEHHEGEHHHLGIPAYLGVFAVLMVLTILTYAVALIDLDHIFRGLNTFVALGIALVKAALVVLFFMHVKFSSRLVKFSIICGLFWLGIMFVLTLADYNSRVGPVVNN